jgi:hypothetical protein
MRNHRSLRGVPHSLFAGKVVRHFPFRAKKGQHSCPIGEKLPELPLKGKRNLCGGLYHHPFFVVFLTGGVAGCWQAR